MSKLSERVEVELLENAEFIAELMDDLGYHTIPVLIGDEGDEIIDGIVKLERRNEFLEAFYNRVVPALRVMVEEFAEGIGT